MSKVLKRYDGGIVRNGLIRWFNPKLSGTRNVPYVSGSLGTTSKRVAMGSSNGTENTIAVRAVNGIITYGTGFFGDAMTCMMKYPFIDISSILGDNYLGDYTIEMAFQVLWTDGGGGTERFLIMSGHGQTSHQLRVQCRGKRAFTVTGYPANQSSPTFNETGCVDTEDFIYLSISVSNTTNTWRVVMNKSLKHNGTGKVGLSPTANKGMYIGNGRKDSNSGALYADCDLQVFDYKIYNRALSNEEIFRNHDAFKLTYIGSATLFNKYNSCAFSYDYSTKAINDVSNNIWWGNGANLNGMEVGSDALRGNMQFFGTTNVNTVLDSKGGIVFPNNNSTIYAKQYNMVSSILVRGVTVYVAFKPNQNSSTEQAIFTNHISANGHGVNIYENVLRGFAYINGAWRWGKAYTPSLNNINYYAYTYDGTYITTVYSNSTRNIEVTQDNSQVYKYIISSPNPMCIGSKPDATSLFKGGTIYACRFYAGAINSNDIIRMINEDKVRLGDTVIN